MACLPTSMRDRAKILDAVKKLNGLITSPMFGCELDIFSFNSITSSRHCSFVFWTLSGRLDGRGVCITGWVDSTGEGGEDFVVISSMTLRIPSVTLYNASSRSDQLLIGLASVGRACSLPSTPCQ